MATRQNRSEEARHDALLERIERTEQRYVDLLARMDEREASAEAREARAEQREERAEERHNALWPLLRASSSQRRRRPRRRRRRTRSCPRGRRQASLSRRLRSPGPPRRRLGQNHSFSETRS